MNPIRRQCQKSTNILRRSFATKHDEHHEHQNADSHGTADSHHNTPQLPPHPIVQRLTRERPLVDYNEYMTHAQGFQRFDFWRQHPLLNINPIRYPRDMAFLVPGWKLGLAVILLVLVLEKLGLKQRVLKDQVAEYHEEVTLKRIPEEFREEAKHLMHH